jgi:hypothetical protein
MKMVLPLGLFLAGAASFLLVFLRPQQQNSLVVFGGITWTAAYFCVLADNYKRRAPIYTRGGPLRYEERPTTYRLHGFLTLLGAFFLFVLLALNIFPR